MNGTKAKFTFRFSVLHSHKYIYYIISVFKCLKKYFSKIVLGILPKQSHNPVAKKIQVSSIHKYVEA